MSEPNKLGQQHITIVSISAPEKPPQYGRSEEWAKVVFQIRDGGPEFSVLVGRRTVSDDNIIRVARHYLHMQTQAIAEATASWRLSDEEYQQIFPSQKTSPYKGPVIPR